MLYQYIKDKEAEIESSFEILDNEFKKFRKKSLKILLTLKNQINI